MLADKTTIVHYIPQRTPMVMIDTLLEATEEHAVSGFAIEPENIFVDQGVLSAPGLIENIAQTAAAQAGYIAHQQQRVTPLGFIAAISDLIIYNLPDAGDVVTTTVRVTNKVLDVTIIEGTVEQGGNTLCNCKMKIFIRP